MSCRDRSTSLPSSSRTTDSTLSTVLSLFVERVKKSSSEGREEGKHEKDKTAWHGVSYFFFFQKEKEGHEDVIIIIIIIID